MRKYAELIVSEFFEIKKYINTNRSCWLGKFEEIELEENKENTQNCAIQSLLITSKLASTLMLFFYFYIIKLPK